MRSPTRTRRALALSVSAATALAAVGIAGSAYASPTFNRTVADNNLVGAAFSASGDILGDVRPELVATGYGPYTVVAGVPQLNPGSMTVYSNAAKNKQGGAIDSWTKVPVFDASANIIFPSQPKLADVDGDGDVDILLGGGFFWDSGTGLQRGTITWWEQRANGGTWIRHDVVTNSPFAYHDMDYTDFDGDGIKDIVTVGEQGFNPSSITDDVVELQFFKGLGGGAFAPKSVLANRGGSSPVVDDVDGDGDLDVISAQYFGVSPVVLGPPSGEASFVWFERTGSAVDGLDASDFTMREIARGQGPAFGVYKAVNLYGDGVDRWVATNHTNKTVGNPGPPLFLRAAPNLFLLTPGADITAPWTATVLPSTVDAGAAFTALARPGQAAPGKVGVGDIDGDGDNDLSVSGDGDPRLFWIEQTSPGVFTQHVLPQSEGWGQAGGSQIIDLNRDGKNEILFSSFDVNSVGIWSS